MKKWDGNFKESKYTETGNIVNDVIENSGKLLHEETLDGYTHEIVDRGSYISEDYYFPSRKENGKPHIHYELRSTGGVFIDGKAITYEGGHDKMAMRKVYSRGANLGRHVEAGYTELDNETGKLVEEGDRLHELAVKFISDKSKIEDEIDKVQAAKISEKDKARIIAQLNAALEKLQQQYDEEVGDAELGVQEEIMAKLETMDETVDELDEQVGSLRSVNIEVASADTKAAADEAEAKKQAFIQMRNEYAKKLQLQMEQAEMMQRQIRARRIRGN